MITPAEFERRMAKIAEWNKHDEESSHSDADDLMCEVLDQLGYLQELDLEVETLRQQNAELIKENNDLRAENKWLQYQLSRKEKRNEGTPVFGPGAEIGFYDTQKEDPDDWVFGPA